MTYVGLCLLLLLLIGSGATVFGAATGGDGDKDSTDDDDSTKNPAYALPSAPRKPSKGGDEAKEPPVAMSTEVDDEKETTQQQQSPAPPATPSNTPAPPAPPARTAKPPAPTAPTVTPKKTPAPPTSPSTPKFTPPPSTPPPHPWTQLPASELVCTVGNRAMVNPMMPPEELCTYLYYSDVIVANNQIYAAEFDESWFTFRKVMVTRSKTKAGVSFNIMYTRLEDLKNDNIINRIKGLERSNIKNYGFLTVLAHSTKLPGIMAQAKAMIEILKNIQGNDKSRKTIIALGLYDYSVSNAWSTYRAQFKAAVETTKADFVIALSSTGWQESDEKCYAALPTSVHPYNKRFPDMKQHGSLVGTKAQYSRRDVKLGLSLELATLLYKMTASNLPLERVPYAKCSRSITDHRDLACLHNLQATKVSDTYVAHVPNNKAYVFIYDDTDTITKKLAVVNTSVTLRHGMAWLVNNVHLGVYDSNCNAEPFRRLEYIKNTLLKIT